MALAAETHNVRTDVSALVKARLWDNVATHEGNLKAALDLDNSHAQRLVFREMIGIDAAVVYMTAAGDDVMNEIMDHLRPWYSTGLFRAAPRSTKLAWAPPYVQLFEEPAGRYGNVALARRLYTNAGCTLERVMVEARQTSAGTKVLELCGELGILCRWRPNCATRRSRSS